MILAHVVHLKNIKRVMAVLHKKNLIRVAVGLVADHEQRLLITQRSPDISHGGYWEFPGGKLELHEPPEIALFRELNEEVQVQVLVYQYLGEVHYEYDAYQVILYGYYVTHYRGQAIRNESQTDLRWITEAEVENYQFPQANRELIRIFNDRRKI